MQNLTLGMIVLILDGIYAGYSGPDEQLDPQVAYWEHETCQVGNQQPCWSWFDNHILLQFGMTTE